MAATHIMTSTTAAMELRSAGSQHHQMDTLIVVDFISISSSTTAAGSIEVGVDDGTNNIYYALTTLEASSSDTLFIDFSSGLPCWKMATFNSTLNTVPQPAGTVTVTFTGGDGSTIAHVGYHYERPTNRR